MSSQVASSNIYGPSISLDAAKKAAAAALAEARKNNWTMAVAIVDPGGHLVYYEKMDLLTDAMNKERQLKGWSRQKKINLILRLTSRVVCATT